MHLSLYLRVNIPLPHYKGKIFNIHSTHHVAFSGRVSKLNTPYNHNDNDNNKILLKILSKLNIHFIFFFMFPFDKKFNLLSDNLNHTNKHEENEAAHKYKINLSIKKEYVC